MNKPKLIRITTVPISFKVLLKGQHRFMSDNGFEVVGISSKRRGNSKLGTRRKREIYNRQNDSYYLTFSRFKNQFGNCIKFSKKKNL